MGITISSPVESFGAKMRERIEPTSQRDLEQEIQTLKQSLVDIKKQIAETRRDRSGFDDEAAAEAEKALWEQYRTALAELEAKTAKLAKIYNEQLRPETKERTEATRKIEERYDTIELSSGTNGDEATLEELGDVETPDEGLGIDAKEEAELLRLAKEADEAEGAKGKVFG